MKKTLFKGMAIGMIMVMVLGTMPVLAAKGGHGSNSPGKGDISTGKVTDKNITAGDAEDEAALNALLAGTEADDDSLTEDELEEAIKVADEDELVKVAADSLEEISDDEKSVAEDVYNDQKSFGKYIFKVYKYILKREIYYRNALRTIDRIEDMKNERAARNAVNAFERKFNRELEKDQIIDHKINDMIDVIGDNKDKLTDAQKAFYAKVLEPVVKKYRETRETIQTIHTRIEELKNSLNADNNKALVAAAEKLEKKGKHGLAAKAYKKVLENGVKTKETYRKAAVQLKDTEGDSPKVFVNGEKQDFDVQPEIRNSSTMVPFRKIAEALGAQVTWDAATKTATFVKGDRTVVVTIGLKYMIINGKRVDIPAAAYNSNGRTMVPLRAISEAMDTDVSFDPNGKVVVVDSSIHSAAGAPTEEDLKDAGLPVDTSDSDDEDMTTDALENLVESAD